MGNHLPFKAFKGDAIIDHFELFGLPRTFELNTQVLEQRFRDLSLECHPDRLIGADAATRRLAAEKTASLNAGFKALQDPISRCCYLLKLKGVDIKSDATNAKFPVSVAFLEEIMRDCEALECAKQSGDRNVLHTIATKVRTARDTALAAAIAALQADDVPTAVQTLGRIQYYLRCLEKVDAVEEELRGESIPANP